MLTIEKPDTAITLRCIFLLVGLKSCVLTIWHAPSKLTNYAVHGDDGRSLTMIFKPNHETFIVYIDQEQDYIEAIRTKMRGTYGTHYFWNLWKVEGSGVRIGLFCYHIYAKGVKPVVMETTVLDKFTDGNGNSNLRSKGDRTHPVILFSKNAVKFESMWLEKEPANVELLNVLEQRLSEIDR